MAWSDRNYERVGDWSARRASLSPKRTAVVVDRTGRSNTYAALDLAELRSFLDDRLADHEIPHHLAFVDEMPTSGPSKIDRGTIEAEFGETEYRGRRNRKTGSDRGNAVDDRGVMIVYEPGPCIHCGRRR